MSENIYYPLVPYCDDTTEYRHITSQFVETFEAGGREILKIDPSGISHLTAEGFSDTSHLLRATHLQQLRDIFDDADASDNDRFVALDLLKNANIAATLGIAGPGMDNVIVRVIADPRVSKNTAELNVEGKFGCMRVVLENEPSSNMRTSRLTSMAIIATLVRRTAKLICPA